MTVTGALFDVAPRATELSTEAWLFRISLPCTPSSLTVRLRVADTPALRSAKDQVIRLPDCDAGGDGIPTRLTPAGKVSQTIGDKAVKFLMSEPNIDSVPDQSAVAIF